MRSKPVGTKKLVGITKKSYEFDPESERAFLRRQRGERLSFAPMACFRH